MLLALMCVGLGVLAGAWVPWSVLRICSSPNPSRVRGDTTRMAWICSLAGGAMAWACIAFAAPALGRDAILYGGLGTVVGQAGLWRHENGEAVCALVCIWVVMYLPFTGMLACLGAAALALAVGYPVLGLMATPVFAAPIALLQFGARGALAMLAGAAVCMVKCYPAWAPRNTHKKPTM